MASRSPYRDKPQDMENLTQALAMTYNSSDTAKGTEVVASTSLHALAPDRSQCPAKPAAISTCQQCHSPHQLRLKAHLLHPL
eukprot:1879063-Amphidinium_carterae.1